MTNLCEKAGQFMMEEINGAKLKEEVFKKASCQMYSIESGINSLKSLLKNFSSCVEPLSKFVREFNEALKKIQKDTPYDPYIDTIIFSQELMITELDLLNKEIVKVYSKTSAWNLIFEQSKEQKKLREEKKKKFEHYEQKLQKIEKDAKKKKNDEYILRNEQKYRIAAGEYIEISERSLNTINDSLVLSWNLINPIISDLILIKRKTFNNILANLNEFSNIKERFEEIKKENKDKTTNAPKRSNRRSAMSFSVHMREKIINNERNSTLKESYTILNFGRLTNSFGKVPNERFELFNQIEDEPY